MALNPLTLRKEAGFLDVSPLSHNAYWIETFDASGASGGMSLVSETDWSSASPVAPAASTPTLLELKDTALGIVAHFDTYERTQTRWKLARATSETGPFVQLAPDEDTINDGFIDTTASGGTYYYQLTALSMDGSASPVIVSAPVTRASIPTPPTGVTAQITSSGTQIKWDPIMDSRTHRLLLYADSGSGFQEIGNYDPNTSSALVTTQESTSVRYYLIAENAQNEKSQPSAVTSVGLHHVATDPTLFQFEVSEMTVAEGEGRAVITVQRSGNLNEPATIRYITKQSTATPPPLMLIIKKCQALFYSLKE